MIKIEKENRTAVLKLNRPEKRNALHPDMIEGLKKALAELAEDDSTRILIITGEGTSFCAGADLEYLNELRKFSSSENEQDSKSLAEMFINLYNFPKPTIAAVNGPAIAGGCGLASVCDFIVADKKAAKFGYTEVKIGFLPAIVSIFLIKRVGEGTAKQLMLTGDLIDAERAYQIGLANYTADNAVEASKELAKRLAENSTLSMRLTKQLLHRVSSLNAEEAVEYCVTLNSISRSSEDFKTGLENFLNKKQRK